MVSKIAGRLALPRISRNGVFYFPEELAKFDGVRLPLRFNHDKSPEGIIGSVTTSYDPEKMQVNYEAEITNPVIQDLLDNKEMKVSLGAKVSRPGQICSGTGTCYQAPVLEIPTEMSIVEIPGIPETTMNTIEKCRQLNVTESYNTSDITKTETNRMAETIDSTPKEVEEKTKITIETDGTIVKPTEKKSEEAESTETKEDCGCQHAQQPEAPEPKPAEDLKVAKPVENNPTPEVPVTKEQPSEEDIQKKIDSEVTKQLATMKESWEKKSEVQESGVIVGKFVDQDYYKDNKFVNDIMERLHNNGFARFEIKKDDFINANTYNVNSSTDETTKKEVTENLTATSTSGVNLSKEVVILPGGKIVQSVRESVQVQKIPQGENTARFFTLDQPDFGAITESTTTDITVGSHTLTPINVTCNVRGLRQRVLKSQLEDNPPALLGAIRETIRRESIVDETKLVLQTMASTANDFGGVTTAPYHISGDDGSTTPVTTATLEDAAGEFGYEAIRDARRILEGNGYDVRSGNIVAYISPRAYANLIADTNVQSLMNNSLPGVATSGILERYLGCQIVVTTNLRTDQNSADRNIVLVKKAGAALATQRDIEIELKTEIKGQYIDIVGTHRIGTEELDKNAYVIISSPNA